MCIFNVLNKYVPLKKKLARGNLAPSMKKQLRKVIVKRSEFESNYRNCIYERGGRPSGSFYTVTSTNVGINPKNSLTFSFNFFATLV